MMQIESLGSKAALEPQSWRRFLGWCSAGQVS